MLLLHEWSAAPLHTRVTPPESRVTSPHLTSPHLTSPLPLGALFTASMRVRHDFLTPLIIATAPILALAGLDALDVALNSLAILFIFDVDDQVHMRPMTHDTWHMTHGT